MSNYSQIFLHLVFIGAFAFFVLLASILLKPFRLHKRRPYSTAALKISYLLYLASFLSYIYMLLFFYDIQPGVEKGIINFKLSLEYVSFLIAFIVPNVGMLARRKFKTWRVNYNVFFTVVNIIIFLYLMVRLFTIDWVFSK
jgi:hypothetical protein